MSGVTGGEIVRAKVKLAEAVKERATYRDTYWGRSCVYSGRSQSSEHIPRLYLYQDTDPTASHLAEDADDTLFENILANAQHVLHHLLPSPTHHSYKLRPRRQDYSLTVKSDVRNFVTRQLFKDMY